ncbi:2OG-Fe(II) oxygenase [Corallococcus sp. BB11-1]|uniref:2OG-Fe(II) oxygenase family protein n=1 Tax=Corallococcus sp. BB11-1 TaxID=2996783 RepID=UPI0022720894|nr:2OG-Fe(II) oxygenase family protein [Corallococcus sp. BB11-1]MCY1034363.1 2OG-Fe(II) oxygenase [Corallococcus sp. BB11-1]
MVAPESWLQSQHLTPERLEGYRAQYREHPAGALVLRDFFQPEVAMSLARFLAEEALFDMRYKLTTHDDYVPEDAWYAAPPGDRFYVMSMMAGVRPECRLSRNVMTFLRFRSEFFGAPFLRFFEQACGVTLDGGDLSPRVMARSHFVSPHIDDFDRRHVAFALYLSPDWRPEYGGALHFVTRDGGTVRMEAEYNSIVLFDATRATLHYVSEVLPEAGTHRRFSVGGWLYAPRAVSFAP